MWYRCICEPVRKLVEREVHHHKEIHIVLCAELIYRFDMRSVQLGQGYGLFAEASSGRVVTQSARGQNLQCHIAVELFITGAVNHTHSSGGYFFQDAVVAECLANHGEGPALWEPC